MHNLKCTAILVCIYRDDKNDPTVEHHETKDQNEHESSNNDEPESAEQPEHLGEEDTDSKEKRSIDDKEKQSQTSNQQKDSKKGIVAKRVRSPKKKLVLKKDQKIENAIKLFAKSIKGNNNQIDIKKCRKVAESIYIKCSIKCKTEANTLRLFDLLHGIYSSLRNEDGYLSENRILNIGDNFKTSFVDKLKSIEDESLIACLKLQSGSLKVQDTKTEGNLDDQKEHPEKDTNQNKEGEDKSEKEQQSICAEFLSNLLIDLTESQSSGRLPAELYKTSSKEPEAEKVSDDEEDKNEVSNS